MHVWITQLCSPLALALGSGDILKICGTRLSYHLVLSLLLWERPHPRAFTLCFRFDESNSLFFLQAVLVIFKELFCKPTFLFCCWDWCLLESVFFGSPLGGINTDMVCHFESGYCVKVWQIGVDGYVGSSLCVFDTKNVDIAITL